MQKEPVAATAAQQQSSLYQVSMLTVQNQKRELYTFTLSVLAATVLSGVDIPANRKGEKFSNIELNLF